MHGPVAHDPLRLELCPSCGYSLEGLPPEGRCPECGADYDGGTVVLHGWARGNHANVATAPPRIAAGLLALQLVYLLPLLLNPRTPAHWKAVALLPGLAVFAWMLWHRWNCPLPGLVQVRLNPNGCLQLDNPGRKSAGILTPWAAVRQIQVDEVSAGRCRIRVQKALRWWRPTTVWTDVVDAEVNCTRAEAAALRLRVEAWRGAGAGGAAAP